MQTRGTEMKRRKSVFVQLALFFMVALPGCDSGNGGGMTDLTGPDVPTTTAEQHGGTLYEGTLPPTSGQLSNMFVQSGHSVGSPTVVTVCAYDHGREDGDEINLWVGRYQLTDSGNPTILLSHDRRCWDMDLTSGYYYEVRIRALNVGSISPNTGAINVSTAFSSVDSDWRVQLGHNGSASLVIQP